PRVTTEGIALKVRVLERSNLVKISPAHGVRALVGSAGDAQLVVLDRSTLGNLFKPIRPFFVGRGNLIKLTGILQRIVIQRWIDICRSDVMASFGSSEEVVR